MRKVLISEQVNIDICPFKQEFNDITNITIGDLHANALKLLFFLVHESIIKISTADYAEIVQIYKTPFDELTLKHINKFNDIIWKMPVLNRDTLVRLIGDELCDRGSNDYFTLKILAKLHYESIPLEILISNHGMGFLEAYETNPTFFYANLRGFNQSIDNLQHLINKQLVSRNDVVEMVEYYKPTLKTISYSLNLERNSLTIYSHAPVDITIIQSLAYKFNVSFLDRTPIELAQTIDAINVKFQEYITTNNVHSLYNNHNFGFNCDNRTELSNPFELITWNRDYRGLNRPETHHDYHIDYVHGHDSTLFNQSNLFNLDNLLGKSPNHHIEKYQVLVSSEVSMHTNKEKKNNMSGPIQRINTLPDLSELLNLSDDESDDSPTSTDSEQFATVELQPVVSPLPSIGQALSPTQRRMKALFYLELKSLAKKRDELLLRHENIAYDIVAFLYDGLKGAADKYFEKYPNIENFVNFKTVSLGYIENARPELENHRGHSRILDKIALVIINFLRYLGIVKEKKPNFHFFSTDTEKKIDAVESCINILDPERYDLALVH